MYLDDLREPQEQYDVVVRSFEEAVNFVKLNGIPNYISFDHDLGLDLSGKVSKSGYDFAKWLVEMDMDEIYTFPDDFSFNVHSANPIGKNNIEAIIYNYLLFKVPILEEKE